MTVKGKFDLKKDLKRTVKQKNLPFKTLSRHKKSIIYNCETAVSVIHPSERKSENNFQIQLRSRNKTEKSLYAYRSHNRWRGVYPNLSINLVSLSLTLYYIINSGWQSNYLNGFPLGLFYVFSHNSRGPTYWCVYSNCISLRTWHSYTIQRNPTSDCNR